jgi:hypothetical protein
VKRFSAICVALSKNDHDGVERLFADMREYLASVESEIHPYFDMTLFNNRIKQLITVK